MRADVEYSVVLAAKGQYTAYLGRSKSRAAEALEVVRNVLIQTGGTGVVTVKVGHKAEAVNVVINGAWNPALRALPGRA